MCTRIYLFLTLRICKYKLSIYVLTVVTTSSGCVTAFINEANLRHVPYFSVPNTDIEMLSKRQFPYAVDGVGK